MRISPLLIVVLLALAGGADAAVVQFSFTEKPVGVWEVAVTVTGADSGGLAGYAVSLEDLSPGVNTSADYTQNDLGAEDGLGDLHGFPLVYLAPGPGGSEFYGLKGPVGTDAYSAGNSQFYSDVYLAGIGKTNVDYVGATGEVHLQPTAVLGWLTSPEFPAADQFQVDATLFNTALDGLLDPETQVTFDPLIYNPLGDMNDDDTVDSLDIAPFSDTILHGPYKTAADFNGDDNIDALDIAPFISRLSGALDQADNSTALPEPATAAGLLLGLVLIGRRR